MLALFAQPARAQDPTPIPTETPVPTVTPTPAYVQEVSLSSGNVFRVEKTLTFGEAATVIMLTILWITLLLAMMVIIPRLWKVR